MVLGESTSAICDSYLHWLMTRIYGSGYPGVEGRGVAGRGFPFYFWPLSFGTDGPIAYLYNDEVSLLS